MTYDQQSYIIVDGPNREGNNKELNADANSGFYLGPTATTDKMLTTPLPIRFGRHVNKRDNLLLLKILSD